ncbi:hypothetical protein O0I10_011756 [Lichtheimia ornata]|uniref:Uncharacterized protein n=1 Tax=Lichtheimia ornata TaxID=688661 RepID=A0AAD7XSD1_9FUNG|nr:uncharacterized protein O0I10_011756 [Lichtheimia ornata]KAJ8652610.1 hypothetical protein O0I10_011756 [Lichtheimia ornata]
MQDLFWVNLCQPIPLIATHHECDSIVTESTLRIRECLTRLTTLLEERSFALLKCAQFDTALRDTNAILKLDPTLALGYLLKGKLYSYHGQQRKAIQVFDQGLTMAGGMDDDEQQHYQQLLKARADAEMMQQKGMDFISKLPLDVVSTSIVPLLMDDVIWSQRKPCPYLQVSRSWRDRFGRGKLCYHIYGSNPSPTQVVSLSNSVQSLVIDNYNPQVGFHFSRQLSALRRLWISGISPRNQSYFLVSLSRIGTSLGDLEISLTQGTMLNVGDIMAQCPHLSRLITYGVANGDLISTLHPYPHFTQPISSLVSLELRALRTPVNHQYAISLLQYYPSLQSLVLYPCRDSRFLQMIYQHCSSLQHLVISTQSRMTILPQPLQHQDNQHGLRSLCIQDENGQYYNMEDIRQCMMTHSLTLESVTIMVGTRREDLDPPPAVQFPRLRHLHCSLGTSGGPPLFGWWIPYHAPNLEHVVLKNTFWRSPELLEALCNMSQIRSLALHATHGAIPPLLRLIEAMGRHGCLEELVLSTESPFITYTTMIHAIGKLTHLKRLTLGKGMIPSKLEESNYMMFHLVTHCHHLCELDIQARMQNLDMYLLVLSTLDHLERIAFLGVDVSTSGIKALARFSRLRHLTLYGFEQPELQHELERLQQTHPMLNISWRYL